MDKSKLIQSLKDQDSRTNLDSIEMNSGLIDIDDEILSSISGGCAPSTLATSCVPPGQQCP